MNNQEPAQRSWLSVQWRKARNPPPPVLRAVLANLAVAIVGGVLIWIYAIVAPSAVPAAIGTLTTRMNSSGLRAISTRLR